LTISYTFNVMYENPCKAAVLSLIKEYPAGMSEYSLIQELEQREVFAADDGSHLSLFRKHFLVMNALYQLQDVLYAQGWYLSISPLAIRLESLKESGLSLPPVGGSETALRDYYLDWRNYEDTGRNDVHAMLARFWGRYLAIDRRLEALTVLGLPADARWAQVRAVYRRLIAQHHPDKGGDPSQFRSIREAYEILLRCYAP
jgi:DnaJ-domain-containing protein 1